MKPVGVSRHIPRIRCGVRAPLPAVGGLVGAGLAVAGSAGPWASVAGELHVGGEVERFQVGGMLGDGVFTLALGAAAGALILWRVLRGRASGFVTGLSALLLLIAAVTGMLNWLDVANMPGVYTPGKYYHTDARAAWGLVVVTFGAAAGAAGMACQVWRDELR